ncbi:hypothetical protein HK405_004493 [Cladochytrium tenue]|nr:hypothetical protein HK405_004493 [Cladochytrium tenue]
MSATPAVAPNTDAPISYANDALVVLTGSATLVRRSIAIPSELRPREVLVAVSHAAQNPTDVQSLDSRAFDHAAGPCGGDTVYGCDFAGIVVGAGSEVSQVRVGDRVAALIWGGEKPNLGAYSHYAVADEAICFKIPSGLDPASAATIPLAATTAWLALFSKGCLAIDRTTSQTVLVWGGSCMYAEHAPSVGQFSIQLAAICGLDVITTCSPRNFDLVRRLGATQIFDYRDPEVVQKIQSVAPSLRYAFDTIGRESGSSVAAAECLLKAGGSKVCTVRPGRANTGGVPKEVEVTDVLVWTAFDSDHSYGEFVWPANAEDHELCAELYEKLPRWIEEGKLRPNYVLLLKGLDKVAEGFELHRRGRISAQKVVYEV